MNKNLSFSLLLFLMYGCDKSQNESMLTGTWITERCEATCISESPATSCSFTSGSETIWAKGIYEFTADGDFLTSEKFYSDSDCITNTITNTSPTYTSVMRYEENQTIILSSGASARALTVDIILANEILSVDTFYTISNGLLCFTDSLILNARSITFDPTDTLADNINFENCLQK